MRGWTRSLAIAFSCLIILPLSATAEDFVRLKNGSIFRCAVLRQDTATVFTTDWSLRHLASPPLQVYTKDEVESIWFTEPEALQRIPYTPLPSRLELGGSAGFQTWAETRLVRRHVLMLALHGGLGITRVIGLELDGSFTFPLGGKADSEWYTYDPGYQVAMNAVAQPFVWKGIVPFALIGGGAAVGIPVGDVLLTASNDARNLINFGLGVKWGSNGLGYRVEWRHSYYIWTPDAANAQGLRTAEQSGDASTIRASLFIYR